MSRDHEEPDAPVATPFVPTFSRATVGYPPSGVVLPSSYIDIALPAYMLELLTRPDIDGDRLWAAIHEIREKP